MMPTKWVSLADSELYKKNNLSISKPCNRTEQPYMLRRAADEPQKKQVTFSQKSHFTVTLKLLEDQLNDSSPTPADLYL